MGITVPEVARSIGVEPEKQLMWKVGNDARDLFWSRYGKEPPKELRKKTAGGGSHCFAVYPDDWADEIAKLIHSQQKVTGLSALKVTLDFRGVVKREVFSEVKPSIIGYTFKDGSSAWRYATGAELINGKLPVFA